MRRYRAYVQPLMALLAVCILLITGGLYMLSNRLVSNCLGCFPRSWAKRWPI